MGDLKKKKTIYQLNPINKNKREGGALWDEYNILGIVNIFGEHMLYFSFFIISMFTLFVWLRNHWKIGIMKFKQIPTDMIFLKSTFF